jgi:hypothetical protein
MSKDQFSLLIEALHYNEDTVQDRAWRFYRQLELEATYYDEREHILTLVDIFAIKICNEADLPFVHSVAFWDRLSGQCKDIRTYCRRFIMSKEMVIFDRKGITRNFQRALDYEKTEHGRIFRSNVTTLEDRNTVFKDICETFAEMQENNIIGLKMVSKQNELIINNFQKGLLRA